MLTPSLCHCVSSRKNASSPASWEPDLQCTATASALLRSLCWTYPASTGSSRARWPRPTPSGIQTACCWTGSASYRPGKARMSLSRGHLTRHGGDCTPAMHTPVSPAGSLRLSWSRLQAHGNIGDGTSSRTLGGRPGDLRESARCSPIASFPHCSGRGCR